MRLIDADAKTFPTPYRINDTEHAKGWNSCLNSISQQSTIDAEPVRHGRWIKSDFLHIGANQYRCSECWGDKWWLYHFSLGDSKYCPNCGAKMMDEVSE